MDRVDYGVYSLEEDTLGPITYVLFKATWGVA